MSESLAAGVELRRLVESDAEGLYRLVAENRAYLGRWFAGAAEQILEDIRDRVRASRRERADGNWAMMLIAVDVRMAAVGTR